MNTTHLLYMETTALVLDNTQIVEFCTLDNGKSVIVLDSTIFYPQGGGQPYDQGLIKNNKGGIFEVQEVRFVEGMVHHIGIVQNGIFEKGMIVQCEVNSERRMLHSLIHSGGHVVDIGLYNLGFKLTPSKGYHFPDGPYIEYCETMDNEDDRHQLKERLQKEVNDLISASYPVHIKLVERTVLEDMAKYIPANIPVNKPLRAMIINSFPAIPCGGTHVESTGQFKAVTIESIKNVKGKLRIRYSVA